MRVFPHLFSPARVGSLVHAAGARAALQLNDGGRESIPEVSGSPPRARSAVPFRFTAVGNAVIPQELTVPDIHALVRRFTEAVLRARATGFDAVELRGAHGYLIVLSRHYGSGRHGHSLRRRADVRSAFFSALPHLRTRRDSSINMSSIEGRPAARQQP